MLSGTSSQAQGPDPGSRRPDGHGSLVEPRAQAPRKGACREDPRSHRPSPAGNHEDRTSGPSWAAWPGQEETRASPSQPCTSKPPSTGCEPASGPLARLNRRREARLPFSRFLDEVTVQVLDPGTLEAFWGPRGRSPEPSPGERGPGLAQEPLPGAAVPETTLALSPQPSSEVTAEAAGRLGSSQAVETSGTHVGSGEQGGLAASPWQPPSRASAADMDKLRLRSPWVPSCLGQSCTLQGRRARSSPSLWDSVLQEQKSELRKRLSYTTHRLQKLESEFGSTRNYLEVELRRAQEELEKVTLKLRRIQTNYMSLQRINRELEQKLYRMGKHYDEEKRALSHEIVALNNHLLDAKVTIDKLIEDNELYRKDCNLAAQLLQCSQTYGRVHKVSELPAEFQERLSLHLEKHGCSLPSTLCRPGSVPLCVIAKVLEKPEPSSLSSPVSVSVSVSDASTRDLAFREGMPKSSLLPPYKEDAYCSDSALFCPEEPRRDRDRRPSVDAVASNMSFLQTQNSTDSAAGEEEEAGAAAYPAAYSEAYPEEFRREAFQGEAFPGESFPGEAFTGYTASLPTSSSYSSFSATSEERERGEASTLTASQRAVYLDGREQLFQRPPPPTYQSSRPYAKGSGALLETPVPPEFELETTFPSYQAEPFSFQAVPKTLVSPNLWSLRAKSPSSRMPRGEARSPREQWRPVHVEDLGAHAFPAPSRRPSPRSFSQRHYARSSSSNMAHGRTSPLYASYKADNFSEDDDFSQSHLAESCFLGACGSAKPMPAYAASEDDGERPQGQLCGVASPEPDSLFSSRDSFEPSSMEGSPEMHPAARRNPQAAFSRSRSSGLSRKDSLTKAQLYGTLLN